jgi:hypothetical protein
MVLFNLPIVIIRYGKFLLLSSLFLFVGCGGGSDCDGGPIGDCRKYVKCIDTFYVDSAIHIALPDSLKNKIEFKNNNGFVSVFNIQQNGNPYYFEENLLYKSVNVECGWLNCYDYFLNQYKTTSYKATDVPFYYSYNLTNESTTDSYKYKQDSKLTGYGIASVHVNDIGFPLPFNRPNNKNSRLLDSVQVNQKLYRNAYQIFLDSSTINYTIIKPIGIYYNQTKGLIGFYLTNGETWGLNE